MSKSSGCCLRACYSYSRFHPRVASLIAAQKVCAQAGASVPHLAEESFDLEEALTMKLDFSCSAPGQKKKDPSVSLNFKAKLTARDMVLLAIMTGHDDVMLRHLVEQVAPWLS